MKIVWEDLPKPLIVFTVRNAAMRNLNTGKIIQQYSANTRINVAQKSVTEKGTFYRTSSAAHHNLNWAFEAPAFGLPNEKAPSAPSSLKNGHTNDSSHTGEENKHKATKVTAPNDGEGRPKTLFQKVMGRFKKWANS